jgi:hypothetical protein
MKCSFYVCDFNVFIVLILQMFLRSLKHKLQFSQISVGTTGKLGTKVAL